MKKLLLVLAAVAAMGVSTNAIAQVGVNINITTQPAWGPAGYDYVRYYYLPDIDAYYDVPNGMYVYNSDGNWLSSRVLPSRYRFDPFNSYKVVINDPTPWRNHDRYRTQYAQYRGRRGQPMLSETEPRNINERSRSWGGYNKYNYHYDHYKGNRWDNDDHHDHDIDRRKGWDKKGKD